MGPRWGGTHKREVVGVGEEQKDPRDAEERRAAWFTGADFSKTSAVTP